MNRRKAGAQSNSAGSFRIVLYPGGMHSRAAVHTLSTALGVFLVWRMTAHAPWWLGIVWYVASFAIVHVAMVPLMTGWHAAVRCVERWIRATVEQELIRFDMLTYERQLERVIARRPDQPER